MIYLSAAIITIVAVECFCRLPLLRLLSDLTRTLHKVQWVLLSKTISDHWKEKVLLVYSGHIALATGKIAIAMGGLAVLVLVASELLDRVLSPSPTTLAWLASWWGLTASLIVSLTYFMARRRVVG